MNLLKKKFLLFGFIAVLLVGIPVSLYMVKTQTENRSHAEKSTTLSFVPDSSATTPITKGVGEDVPLDIMVNPGTNLVSFVKLEIQYDETKLATASANAIKVNEAAFPVVLEGPVYMPGKIGLTLSIGSDPTKALQATAKAVTVTFKTLAETAGTPTNITFGNNTEILSIGSNDQASENVLLSVNPAVIQIGASSVTPTSGGTITPTTPANPTSTPIPTAIQNPTSQPIPTAIPTGVGGPVSTQVPNQPPICTALNIDRETTGTAPYSITFTAVGNDPDGTISKVTFNYGDGPVDNVTDTGGIGSNSVSVQRAHTYNNPGTYTASAMLTDNNNGMSDINTCKTTITVQSANANGSGDGSGSGLTVYPTISPTGPGDTIVGIGVAAAILTIIGGLLFFAL